MKSFCLKFLLVFSFFYWVSALDEMTSLTLLELKKKSENSNKHKTKTIDGKDRKYKNTSTSINESMKNNQNKDNITNTNNQITNKNPYTNTNTNTNTTQSNYTFEINKTANNSDCVPECTLNCQMHFVDPTEQKYCLINVCHCELIETNTNTNTNINTNTNTNINTAGLKLVGLNILVDETVNSNRSADHLPEYNINESQQVEKENFHILVIFLFVIFIPLWVYSLLRMLQNIDKSEMVCYEFPYDVKHDYMLMGEFHE
jgi:hypothetical protein